jgi:hypothetical protein
VQTPFACAGSINNNQYASSASASKRILIRGDSFAFNA